MIFEICGDGRFRGCGAPNDTSEALTQRTALIVYSGEEIVPVPASDPIVESKKISGVE